jgi:PHYB activation tagged suppressor 1
MRCCFSSAVRYFPTKLNRRCTILQGKIRRQLNELVEARRKRIRVEGGVYGSDLLGLMLEDEGKAKGSGERRFTTQQVIDECRTFFFAGHETTAGLLAWAMVLLSVHQEWQERVRREVVEAWGGGAGRGEALDSNALSKLKLV